MILLCDQANGQLHPLHLDQGMCTPRCQHQVGQKNQQVLLVEGRWLSTWTILCPILNRHVERSGAQVVKQEDLQTKLLDQCR